MRNMKSVLDKDHKILYDNFRCKAIILYGKRKGAPLVKNQAYRMALLFDFYGDMLTERQREFYDLYYNEDLSLAEIAENYDITRQGVRDVIVRAEGILTELEDKTGIIRRFQKMQEQLELIGSAADEILNLSDDMRTGQLVGTIKNAVAAMKQE